MLDQSGESPAADTAQADAIDPERKTGQQTPSRIGSSSCYWIVAGLVVLSVTLTCLAGYFRSEHGRILEAGVFLIAAVGLSDLAFARFYSISLPASFRRRLASFAGIFVVGVLFVGQLIVIGVAVYRHYSTDNPSYMIGIIALAVSAATMVVCLVLYVVPAMRHSSFNTAIGLGFVALLLGGLCVPKLRSSTESFYIPRVSGLASLYATGGADQGLSVHVRLRGPRIEDFSITNLSRRRSVHWLLLLEGDARLPKLPLVRHEPVTVVSPDGTSTVTEGISGTLGPRAQKSFGGQVAKRFSATTAGRTVVSLPSYGQGQTADIDESTYQSIASILGGRYPKVRPMKYFTVTVTGLRLASLEQVTQANHTAVASPRSVVLPTWSSHAALQVTYVTADQRQLDESSDTLVILSILLGVAGAGLFASFQETIRGFGSTQDGDRAR